MSATRCFEDHTSCLYGSSLRHTSRIRGFDRSVTVAIILFWMTLLVLASAIRIPTDEWDVPSRVRRAMESERTGEHLMCQSTRPGPTHCLLLSSQTTTTAAACVMLRVTAPNRLDRSSTTPLVFLSTAMTNAVKTTSMNVRIRRCSGTILLGRPPRGRNRHRPRL